MEKKTEETGKGAARQEQNLIRRAIIYLVKESPGILPLALLQAAYPYIGILLSARILTELADSGRDMGRLFRMALLLVGLNFLGRLLLSFGGQLLDVMQYTVLKYIERDVAEKAWKMDYAMSADPKINETKHRITGWHYDRGPLALVGQTRGVFQAFVSIGISVALVVEFFRARAVGENAAFLNHWSVSVLFLALLSLSIAYSVYSSFRIQKVYFKSNERAEKPMNRMTYLMDSCFARYQNGKDIRMFHGEGQIFGKLRELSGDYIAETEPAYRYERRKTACSILVSRAFELLVYLFVGAKAVFGAFGVGSILKYTGMVAQLGNGVTKLCDTVRDFLQNMEYVNVYFAYLDMPNATADGTLPVTEEIRENYEIEFRNVGFTYPGAAHKSLSGINCRFRKGEKIAIVGRNGSGKTTFIKLLCRLCDPQEGEILLNGVDIRKYRYQEYLSFFSTVFQDYQIFDFTLGENVAAESEYDRDRAVEALEDAGFGERFRTLEKGLDTQLFKRFSDDGVELSGGESQKVAIARCLYKGAIYISHRLSSCCFCHRILVFEEGRIAEQGSHEELLAAEGLYRRLWDAQAQYYA